MIKEKQIWGMSQIKHVMWGWCPDIPIINRIYTKLTWMEYYDIHNEDEGFFKPFPKNDVYSWYKGYVFPDDMGEKILRPDCKICLFNNS